MKKLIASIKSNLKYAYSEVYDALAPHLPKEERTRSIVLFIIVYILTATLLTERLAHVVAFSWILYCLKSK